MKKQLYIRLLVGLLLLAPALLYVQQFLNEPILKKLSGSFPKEDFYKLNDSTWFAGSFQSQFEKSMNQQFGYRSTFVRLRNQVLYSVFSESSNKVLLRYPNDYFITASYLDSYQGLDFKGANHFRKRVNRLAEINTYLKSKGKLLLVVLAPDKASYFPQEFNLPPLDEIDSTNHSAFLGLLREKGISTIDFKTDFIAKKPTTPAPLFSRRGIHWSIYGMNYAMDSISAFIGMELNREMPRLVAESIRFSEENQTIEHDLEDALNLLIPKPGERLGYQEGYWTEVDSLPRMLIISDSFFYQTFISGLGQKFMYDSQFWYYNNRALKFGDPALPKDVVKQSLDSLIQQTNVVMLMTTSDNLADFPWYFDKRFERFILNGEEQP